MKEFNLSKEQKAAFDFLMEFYSPESNRAQGRTYVLACVIVKTALEHPGLPINLIDHHDIISNRSDRHTDRRFMVGQINSIIHELPEDVQHSFNFSGTASHGPKTVEFRPTATGKKVIHDTDLIPNFEPK